ncbi:MAG: hypothetical protein R3A80_12610 [Bdellovibrionota bacterium]
MGIGLSYKPITYYIRSFFYQRSFLERVRDSVAAEKDLDLRDFKRGDWDKIVWVAPYENPCELGEAFKAWWLFCRGAQEDSEFKIFFLRNSEPVAGFRVLRFYLDLVESNIPKDIEREETIFKFDHFEQFPTVQQHIQ